MSTRLAYDDAWTPADLGADCLATQAALVRPVRSAATRLSQEQGKHDIAIPDAAARLAAALNLQLDGE